MTDQHERTLRLPQHTVGAASALLVELGDRLGYRVAATAPRTFQLVRSKRGMLRKRTETMTVAFTEDRNGTGVRATGDIDDEVLSHLGAVDPEERLRASRVAPPERTSGAETTASEPVGSANVSAPGSQPDAFGARPAPSRPARPVRPSASPGGLIAAVPGVAPRPQAEVSAPSAPPAPTIIEARQRTEPAAVPPPETEVHRTVHRSPTPVVQPTSPTSAPPPAEKLASEPTPPAQPSDQPAPPTPSPTPASPAPASRLHAVSPAGTVFDLQSAPVVVGRNPEAPKSHPSAGLMTVADPSVSKSHAVVWIAQGRLMVDDLHSTNGTTVEFEAQSFDCTPGQVRTFPLSEMVIRVGDAPIKVELAG